MEEKDVMVVEDKGEVRRRLSLTFFSGKGDTSIGTSQIFGEKSQFISIQTW